MPLGPYQDIPRTDPAGKVTPRIAKHPHITDFDRLYQSAPLPGHVSEFFLQLQDDCATLAKNIIYVQSLARMGLRDGSPYSPYTRCYDGPPVDVRGPRIRSYCSIGLAGVGTAGVLNVEFAVPITVEVLAGASWADATLNRRLSDLEEISGSAIIAAALAAELGRPSLDHLNLFQNVKEAVLSTGGAEQPWESNGLGRRVYLTGPPPRLGSTQDQPSDASREWAHVDKTTIAELETFLHRHGSSSEADYAQACRSSTRVRQAIYGGAVLRAAPPLWPR
jgi:hypothetical protein